MKLSDVITNPARMKIMQLLQREGSATTKQICRELPEIPPPTLYRHINYLLKEEVLTILEERRVRGSTERLLALNAEKLAECADIADGAYQFLMGLYGSFQRYARQPGADPVADMLSLRTYMLSLGDESYAALFRELRSVIEKYSQPEVLGKNRSLSVISAPITEEKTE